ncbi:1-aminocyclopropane-1-carboxylate synthase 2 [Capsicum chinense]|nr:1-aminocyclopropane-1-carboxylate synthase 2 [Capsicum chinense]
MATNEQHGENSSYFDGWKAYDDDPFHLLNNPYGVIQMGLAENQLFADLVEEWIKRNPNGAKGLNLLGELSTSKIIMACLNS